MNTKPGQIVILNGTPRSGKTSIVIAIQKTFDGAWMNLGGSQFKKMIPQLFDQGLGFDLEVKYLTLNR